MFGTIKETQKDFMRFAAFDKMLVTGASAICIGLATKDAISELMNEVILPMLMFLAKGSIANIAYLKALEKTTRLGWLNAIIKGIGRVSWIFIVWILILYVTYVVFAKLISIDFLTPRIETVENAASYVKNAGNWIFS